MVLALWLEQYVIVPSGKCCNRLHSLMSHNFGNNKSCTLDLPQKITISPSVAPDVPSQLCPGPILVQCVNHAIPPLLKSWRGIFGIVAPCNGKNHVWCCPILLVVTPVSPLLPHLVTWSLCKFSNMLFYATVCLSMGEALSYHSIFDNVHVGAHWAGRTTHYSVGSKNKWSWILGWWLPEDSSVT